MIAPRIDAAAVWPNGRVMKGQAQANKVQDADAAIASLQHGAPCVYVRRDDAEQVSAWAKGRAGSGEAQ